MTTNAERGPVAGAPFENNTRVGGRAGSSEHSTQRATPASGRVEMLRGLMQILLGGPDAMQDRAMLRDCPLHCGAVHMFYVPAGTWRNGQPIIRAPRCAPHRQMRLDVVAVLPATGSLAGQRKRGAA